MAGAVKPIPEGYHSVTLYFTVPNAEGLLEFIKQVFDAEETYRMAGPDGSIRHAEARIGDSMVMIGQSGGEWKPRPNTVHVYVPDVDATVPEGAGRGATSTRELTTQFYGDRSGGVEDAPGNRWWIATHVEDVPVLKSPPDSRPLLQVQGPVGPGAAQGPGACHRDCPRISPVAA